jgi:hypothetical protein
MRSETRGERENLTRDARSATRRSWPLLALACCVLAPAPAGAEGRGLAAWASRHWREDPKLLRARLTGLRDRAGARALRDTWKLTDQLVKVDRFFADRPEAEALRQLAARQLRVGGRSAAQIDATGRLVAGIARMVYAGLEPRLSRAERLEHLQRAAALLKTMPMTIKAFQTVLNTAEVSDSLLSEEQRRERWAQTFKAAVGRLRQTMQSEVPAMTDRQRERWLGPEATGVDASRRLAAGSIAEVYALRVREPRGGREIPAVAKVLKPGLQENIDDTVQSVEDGFGILQQLLRRPRFLPRVQGDTRRAVLAALDSAREIFPEHVRSYAREGNFALERDAMVRFRRYLARNPYVVIPRPIPEESTPKKLVMTMVQGDTLSGHLRRFERAQEARRIPLPRGALPRGERARDEAIARARQYAVQAYGLEAVGPALVAPLPGDRGYRITLRFEHGSQPGARIEVLRSGKVAARGLVPDLSPRAVAGLERRMLDSFLWTVIRHGELHADPTQANLGVLPDGRSLSMLDFGNVIRVPRERAAVDAIRGVASLDAPRAARGLLQMSAAYKRMDPARKERARAAVEGVLSRTLDALRQRRFEELGRDWTGMVATLHEAGVTPSASEVAMLRAMFSMVGNVFAFERALAPYRKPGRLPGALVLAGRTLRSVASNLGPELVPLPGLGRLIQARKDERARRMAEEARALREEFAAAAPRTRD